ncbi:monooxygenase [Arthrobacter koreensis]|uniref:acyl-CoA dehydrogenase family protein n=1 Tax=Arthrobacter koreensis TaxID=199136 RepID=UPI0012643B3F|nr:acyl-CoA dehydrogenase family protein [Arthrobacter koreensis]
MTASLLTRYGHTPAPEAVRWFEIADEVAAILGADALERDAANKPPFTEVEILRRSGLLPLTIPARFGGAGISWSTAFEIVQRVARADNSIGQLLGYHYIFQAFPCIDLDPARGQDLADECLIHQWLWSSTGTPQGPQATAVRTRGGYRVTGRKPFATGSRVADRIYARAVLDDGSRLALVIDTASEGVVRHDDWDVLGSRLTATNTIEFRDVFVPDSEVITNLGTHDGERLPHQVLTTPAFQLLFAHAYLAAAEGAVLAARDYTLGSARPWYHAEVESASDDPFIQNHYGSFTARLQALAAVVEQATTALQWAFDAGDSLTAADRAGVAEQIAAAKVTAHEVSLDVTARIFDVTGARAAGSKYGFDRYWRDVRTHTLHDPVAWKYNELGRFFLNGTEPVPSAYR